MKKLLLLLSAAFALASCRLYEPNRYDRNAFPAGTPTTRVLMIGDSLTYYNDLPGLLQQFSLSESAPIHIDQVTTPFASLKFHWTMGKAQNMIRNNHYDYIILQDFSRKPVTEPEDSANYFRLYADLAHASGAKVILFENWTRAGHEDEFIALQNFYRTLAPKLNATVAPIGDAWHTSLTQRPNLTLLIDDRHPTDAGSYIAACIFYDMIYHKKSDALPDSLPGPKLDPATLHFLRQTADAAATGN